MSSYYSYVDYIPECKYCKCTKLVELNHDVTCTDCGAEQGCGIYVSDYNSKTFAEIEGQTQEDLLKKKCMKKFKETFDVISYCADISDNVKAIAIDMMRAFEEERKFSIQKKEYYAMAAACIFYSSKIYVPIDVKLLLKASAVEERDFSKCCRSIMHVLGSKRSFKQYITTGSSYDATHDVNKCFLSIFCVPSSSFDSVRKIAFKLYDKIKEKIPFILELATLSQFTIITTLVYMAFKIQKVKIALKDFAKDVDITSATIMKTESKLLSILSSPHPN